MHSNFDKRYKLIMEELYSKRENNIINESIDNLTPHIKKMQAYAKKYSDPERLAKSIDNPDKLINRWLAAIKIGWENAAKVFEYEIKERGLLTQEEIDEKKSQISIDDLLKIQKRDDEKWSTSYARPVYIFLTQLCEERNYTFKFDDKSYGATTDEGYESMSRNGRAWTIGYKFTIQDKTGKTKRYNFDVVTSESCDGGIYGYVWGRNPWRRTSLKEFKENVIRTFDYDFERDKN